MKLRLLIYFVVFIEVILMGGLIESLEFKLNDISPNQEVVSFFSGESQSLSIGDDIYQSVKWYLNGKLVKENNNIFVLNNLDSAIHIVRVDVVNGTDVDSKTWSVIIKEKQITKETGLDSFRVVYYVYISVLFIVILLVVRLLVIERKRN